MLTSVEHLRRLDERRSSAPFGSLRRSLYECEGVEATDDAIGRGLRAWAIQRMSSCLHRTLTAMVFGRCASDAVRRVAAPARLGEECHGDVTVAAPITSGWDDPVVWPEFAAAAT